uniref:Uncharacterized protein n=1 Tax=Oryza punctata TaxID=4537 RepID=A0A0E0M5Q5_ORYPU
MEVLGRQPCKKEEELSWGSVHPSSAHHLFDEMPSQYEVSEEEILLVMSKEKVFGEMAWAGQQGIDVYKHSCGVSTISIDHLDVNGFIWKAHGIPNASSVIYPYSLFKLGAGNISHVQQVSVGKVPANYNAIQLHDLAGYPLKTRLFGVGRVECQIHWRLALADGKIKRECFYDDERWLDILVLLPLIMATWKVDWSVIPTRDVIQMVCSFCATPNKASKLRPCGTLVKDLEHFLHPKDIKELLMPWDSGGFQSAWGQAEFQEERNVTILTWACLAKCIWASSTNLQAQPRMARKLLQQQYIYSCKGGWERSNRKATAAAGLGG